MMFHKVGFVSLLLVVALLGSAHPAFAAFPEKPIQIMAPASPGGGWDTTARTIAHLLEKTGISPVPVKVFNAVGAGGTAGLAQLATQHRGDPYTICITGLTMQGSIHTYNSKFTFADTTPLARLIAEFSVIVVRPDSPYQTFHDVVADWKVKQRGFRWAGGGAGGPDHQLVALMAKTIGLPPSAVNYIIYEGGGAALPQILGGRLEAISAGLAEYLGQIEGGALRSLAVSSDKRLEALPNVPTLRELGYDATMGNWRGLIGPPDLPKEAGLWYIEALKRLHDSPEWKETRDRYDWNDYFLTDGFAELVKSESEKVRQTLVEIGIIK